MSNNSTPHGNRPPDGRPPVDRIDAAELADLYAAGALTELEHLQFEARLRAGDDELLREVERIRPVLAALLTPGDVPVAAGVRARIEAQILGNAPVNDSVDPSGADDGLEFRAPAHDSERAPIRHAAAAQGLEILRQAAGRWRTTGLKGIRYRTLYADMRANRRTTLLQMDPGTQLPDHDHAGTEEVYIVSGELRIGEETLRAGDYFRTAAGARHPTPVSPTGCICIIISSYGAFPVSSWFGFARAAITGLFRPRA